MKDNLCLLNLYDCLCQIASTEVLKARIMIFLHVFYNTGTCTCTWEMMTVFVLEWLYGYIYICIYTCIYMYIHVAGILWFNLYCIFFPLFCDHHNIKGSIIFILHYMSISKFILMNIVEYILWYMYLFLSDHFYFICFSYFY